MMRMTQLSRMILLRLMIVQLKTNIRLINSWLIEKYNSYRCTESICIALHY